MEEGYLNPKGLILLRLYREVLEYTPLNNLKNLPPPLSASQAINPSLLEHLVLRGTERPQLPTPTG